MIKRLKISNLVLVDSCEIELSSEFNAITGETGSGKSLFLSAIDLLLGEKADASCIRTGEEKASIEADIELPSSSEMKNLFNEFHIDFTKKATLRREILKNNKSKAFFNDEPIPLHVVKKLGSFLVTCSDQHACLILKEEESPRIFLDTFLQNSLLIEEFQKFYSRSQELEKTISTIKREEAFKDKEIEELQKEIKEFHDTDILHVDDQALFQEFRTFQASEEAMNLSFSLLQELDEGKSPISQLVFRAQKQGEALSSLNPQHGEVLQHLQTAFSSIKEASFLLRKSQSSSTSCDKEKARLEDLLKRIDQLKKRYGNSSEELSSSLSHLETRLNVLLKREEELLSLQHEMKSVQEALQKLSQELHERRKNGSFLLSSLIEKHIKDTMHHASFEIEVLQGKRTQHGDDTIRFFFTPNPGEKKKELKETASGGELARIFLTLQTILVDTFQTPSILFDEIDASIGGVTAVSVGKKLKEMGKKRQVIAITHFPQVASYAHAHFSIEKRTENDRTFTTIRKLTKEKEKEKELSRMIGKE